MVCTVVIRCPGRWHGKMDIIYIILTIYIINSYQWHCMHIASLVQAHHWLKIKIKNVGKVKWIKMHVVEKCRWSVPFHAFAPKLGLSLFLPNALLYDDTIISWDRIDGYKISVVEGRYLYYIEQIDMLLENSLHACHTCLHRAWLSFIYFTINHVYMNLSGLVSWYDECRFWKP